VGDTAEQERAHADADHGSRYVCAAFVVAHQASPTGHPAERALHDPSAWQHLEVNLRRFGGRVTLRLLPAVLPGRGYDSPEPNEGAGGCRSLPHTRTGRAWPRPGWRRSCGAPARFSALEEALPGRVVQRVGPPAHRRGDVGAGQRRLVVAAGMLHGPVGMMNQAGAGPLTLGGHEQR